MQGSILHMIFHIDSLKLTHTVGSAIKAKKNTIIDILMKKSESSDITML